MFRQTIGSRKKSIQASQYRVGRYGLTADAELSVTRTSLVISAASAPRAAPRDESVMVDRNSAMAPTPSMDTAMNATAPTVRSAMSDGLSPLPDSEVAAMLEVVRPPGVAATGCEPNSVIPVKYAVTATRMTADSVYTMSAIS